MSPVSMVWRLSSAVIRISCSFSPGRMPMISTGRPGAMASARSVTRIDGIFGMKISPPTLRSRAFITRSTASSRVIQNRVMRSSVMVRRPSAI